MSERTSVLHEVRLVTNAYPHTNQSQDIVIIDERKAKPPHGSNWGSLLNLNLIGVGVTSFVAVRLLEDSHFLTDKIVMKKTGKIWMDGRMVSWDSAMVHVLSNALHYGTGVFEGIRCYKTDKGPAVFRLNDHIDRLFYSAGCLGIRIPYSRAEMVKAVLSLIKINKVSECYIRPVAFCGYDRIGLDISGSKINTAVILWPWGAYLGDKISAAISGHRRLSRHAVPIDAKISGYYVNSVIASAEAKKRGADEAILLDDDGYVAEGAGENIFIVKKGIISTPAKGAILPGLTRDSVIKIAADNGFKVNEKKITVSQLKNADEVFFTGTAVEVCPVVKINGRKVGNGMTGPVTLKIKEEYNKIIKGHNSKYNKWLTHPGI